MDFSLNLSYFNVSTYYFSLSKVENNTISSFVECIETSEKFCENQKPPKQSVVKTLIDPYYFIIKNKKLIK